MSITIYGASDDLVEVEGDIREEFTALDDDMACVIATSNGVAIRVMYSNSGVWRIVLVSNPLNVHHTIAQAPEDDDDNYSDRCTIEGEIDWVACGNDIAVAR